MPTSAGYSGTPLKKKLGIKADCQIALVNVPDHLWNRMSGKPASPLDWLT